APSPTVLIVSRVVLGLAIGLASTNVPVYLSEVAPPQARGWVVSLFQLAVTVGIVVAYLTDYAFAGVEGWRWMLGLAVAPALVFGTGMFFLPETPLSPSPRTPSSGAPRAPPHPRASPSHHRE